MDRTKVSADEHFKRSGGHNGRGDGFVHVRGAREHNLKDVEVRIPRDALVVFTGVWGRGSLRWRLELCTPRRRGDIWSRWPRMHGGCFTKCPCR